MNIIPVGGAVALSIILAACGKPETAGTENRLTGEAAQTPGEAVQVHSGTGTVKAVAGNRVKIAHGAIESVGWPAMTMTFAAPTGVPQGVEAGSQVNFSFRQDNGAYVLTSVQPR